MSQSSMTLHEENLPPEILDRHRAIVSLMEELEATDWYDQRAHACTDPELRAILEHNRDEEKEHAAMVLEWLRRTDPGYRENLQEYLFKEGSITAHEPTATGGAGEAGAADLAPPPRGSHGSLGIGSLRAMKEGGL